MKIWKSTRRIVLNTVRNRQIRLFPIRHSLRGYTSDNVTGDARAGFNVALLAFPQGLAYAAIAGIPIQYGIYGSAIAALIGPLFSGSRFIVLGPTNATSVLIFASFLSLGMTEVASRVAVLPLIVFLTGIFLVLGSFLKVANLIQYVSRSVVTGYITAAAIFIILNQLRKTFGYDFQLPEGASFFTVIWMTLTHLPSTHLPTLLLSICAGVFYYFAQRRFNHLPNVALTLFLFSLLSIPINILLGHTAWFAQIETLSAINTTDWRLEFPTFSPELISNLASVALVIAFLSTLEGISIGKSLASRCGRKLDANQEMFGMGMANLACSFYQGMPASGSLTRSQLNWASGSASPLSIIISGLLCALGAYTIGPLLSFIPTSVLGVVVIAIGISLLNRHVLRVVWNATKSDRIVFITTFLAALLIRLDFAIILGSIVSILLFLRKAAQPELIEYFADDEGRLAPSASGADNRTPEISIVHVEGDLFFGASELFRDQMRHVCEKPNLRIVVLKMRNAYHLDATSILALEELVRYMQEQNRTLLISEVRKDALRIFRDSRLTDRIGRDNIFPDNPTNPTLSTSKALKRAMILLNGEEADIRIFLGRSQKQKKVP